MMQSTLWLLALAYIAGLCASGVSGGLYVLCGITLIGLLLRRRIWPLGPRPLVWMLALGVSLIASFYLHWRMPHPGQNDISLWLKSDPSRSQTTVLMTGQVSSKPRLTRSQKAQFWLEATHITPVSSNPAGLNSGETVHGRLYVTVPLLQATGVYPGQFVNVQGVLYAPKPGGGRCVFDFQNYLAQSGSFAGFSGKTLDIPPGRQPSWGGWQLQKRIVRSQVSGLGVPAGPLVSAMVIGNQAVDIPFEIKDGFVRSGLSHALAASGFQVSLILGVILSLTRRFPSQIQAGIGGFCLLLFLSLTGFQPSVVRAVLMGMAVLLGVVSDRAVQPLNALLLVATAMLIWDPNWIGDLGFQLSFLATLGLLVSATALSNRMDWMPTPIAAAIAVPMAATIWTLPIQIFNFCLVSPYSLLANLVTAPLITVISLGGFISAILGLIWPVLGSLSAKILYYPTLLLIQIVQGFGTLPGNTFSTGTISILQLLGVYALWIGVWKVPQIRQRYLWAGAVAIALLVIPTVNAQARKQQVTILESPSPVMVLQYQGQVGLWATGPIQTPEFSVLPFLRQQGINRLDWAFRLTPKDQSILAKSLQLPPAESSLNSVPASGIDGPPVDSQRQTQRNIGVISPKTGDLNLTDHSLHLQGIAWSLTNTPGTLDLESKAINSVLVWPGKSIDPKWLEQNLLKAAIATGKLDETTAQTLQRLKIPLYSVQEKGAMTWTPEQGILPLRDLQTQSEGLP